MIFALLMTLSPAARAVDASRLVAGAAIEFLQDTIVRDLTMPRPALFFKEGLNEWDGHDEIDYIPKGIFRKPRKRYETIKKGTRAVVASDARRFEWYNPMMGPTIGQSVVFKVGEHYYALARKMGAQGWYNGRIADVPGYERLAREFEEVALVESCAPLWDAPVVTLSTK